MSLVSSFAFLIGYLWAIWDNKKQTWHDKAAGTFVVKHRANPTLARVGLSALRFAGLNQCHY